MLRRALVLARRTRAARTLPHAASRRPAVALAAATQKRAMSTGDETEVYSGNIYYAPIADLMKHSRSLERETKRLREAYIADCVNTYESMDTPTLHQELDQLQENLSDPQKQQTVEKSHEYADTITAIKQVLKNRNIIAVGSATQSPNAHSFFLEINPENQHFSRVQILRKRLRGIEEQTKITLKKEILEHLREQSINTENQIRKSCELITGWWLSTYRNQDTAILNQTLVDLHALHTTHEAQKKLKNLSPEQMLNTLTAIDICESKMAAAGQVLEERRSVHTNNETNRRKQDVKTGATSIHALGDVDTLFKSLNPRANPTSQYFFRTLRLITNLDKLDNLDNSEKTNKERDFLRNELTLLCDIQIAYWVSRHKDAEPESLCKILQTLHTEINQFQKAQEAEDLPKDVRHHNLAQIEGCRCNIAAIEQILEQRAKPKAMPAATM